MAAESEAGPATNSTNATFFDFLLDPDGVADEAVEAVADASAADASSAARADLAEDDFRRFSTVSASTATALALDDRLEGLTLGVWHSSSTTTCTPSLPPPPPRRPGPDLDIFYRRVLF